MRDHPKQIEQMIDALKVGAFLIAKELGRLPTQEEVELLWSVIQRDHGIPEHQIEPASQRRWN